MKKSTAKCQPKGSNIGHISLICEILEVPELCEAQLGPPRNFVEHITSNYFGT